MQFTSINIEVWMLALKLVHDHNGQLKVPVAFWSMNTSTLKQTGYRLMFHTSQSRYPLLMLVSSLVETFVQEALQLKKKCVSKKDQIQPSAA